MCNRNCNCNNATGTTNTNSYYSGNNGTDWNHVHEITGSTEIVTECQNCHNHRFCNVSGESIRVGNSHVHEFHFNTDTSDGHSHECCGRSSAAIAVGNGKHVHFIYETTTFEDGHVHRLQAATLIESPTDFEC